jgi:hypothetical protein
MSTRTTRTTRRRITGAIAAPAVAIALLGALGSGAAAAPNVTTSNGCPPSFADLRAAANTAVTKRLTTLTGLVTSINDAQDPWAANGGLDGTLNGVSSGLTTLNQSIQTGCYASRQALRADVDSIFTGYRVYWLRVPQSKIIEGADHLGVARQQLGTIAQNLAGMVGSNAKAQADLAAMNAALGTFDSTLGTIPTLTGHVAAVPGLQPAVDMSADVAALQAARGDLKAGRQALGSASADAKKVVADLGNV